MRISDWSSDVCSSDLVRICRPLPGSYGTRDGLRHYWRQMLRPEAEPLVQLDMLRALGKGEQRCLARAPLLKESHGRCEQSFSDASVPEIGTHGQRAKEAEAPPVRGEVGTDQYIIVVGAERSEEHTSELQSLM